MSLILFGKIYYNNSIKKIIASVIIVAILSYATVSYMKQSSIFNLMDLEPAFAVTTPTTLKTTVNTTATTNTNYDISVEKAYNNSIIVKKGKTVIYNGPDAPIGIQLGINNLLPRQQMYLYNGSYSINKPLNFTAGIYVHGQGNNTILNYSHLGARNAVSMSKDSRLANIKISGSINPLPDDFTQKIYANNNVRIENISISNMGYGIETSSKLQYHSNRY